MDKADNRPNESAKLLPVKTGFWFFIDIVALFSNNVTLTAKLYKRHCLISTAI